MLKIIDLKKFNPPVDVAIAQVEIEIERGHLEGISAIKVLHGYGSHGKGGKILIELRKCLKQWKKQGKISDYFAGDKWNIFSAETLTILKEDKSIAGDADLDKSNPGITIISLREN